MTEQIKTQAEMDALTKTIEGVVSNGIIDDKSMHETTSESGETRFNWLPSGIVSFAEFDAMSEAKQAGIKIKNEAGLLKAMIENIMELEPDEDTDKVQMIIDVTAEFASRVQAPDIESKELSEMALKELHYKEVLEDNPKAVPEDFKGGCVHCGFGDDLVKSLDKCPHCWNENDS